MIQIDCKFDFKNTQIKQSIIPIIIMHSTHTTGNQKSTHI